MKLAFFDTKTYDMPGFDHCAEGTGLEIKYFETRLNEDTVSLANGYDAVCVFVNDTVNAAVIEKLHGYGVKLLVLRCAGFNNVDIAACQGKIRVFRVPAYSPHAVAEHAMALLLTINRRTHKAYIRTRDFNFSLQGFVGFDLYGKTVGVIGTGKIGRVRHHFPPLPPDRRNKARHLRRLHRKDEERCHHRQYLPGCFD